MIQEDKGVISIIASPYFYTGDLEKAITDAGYKTFVVKGPIDDRTTSIHRTIKMASTPPKDIGVTEIKMIFNAYDEVDARGQLLNEYLAQQPIPVNSCGPVYDISRHQLKEICLKNQIKTPLFFFVLDEQPSKHKSILERMIEMNELGVEKIFIKPLHGFGSDGIDKESCQSIVDQGSRERALAKIVYVADKYGGSLIEEFIGGEEVTVLLLPPLAKGDIEPLILDPIQFNFSKSKALCDLQYITEDEKNNYNLDYWYEQTKYHGECVEEVKQVCKKFFMAASFQTYSRFDIRVRHTGTSVEYYLIDANSACMIFQPQCSSDSIIKANGKDNVWLINYLIDSGLNQFPLKYNPHKY